MNNIFDFVPVNFFSILNSKNKVLYCEALFVLRDFLEEAMPIKRREYASQIAYRLEGLLETSSFDEEEDEDEPLNSEKDKANLIINRLKECGWIDFEYLSDSNFEEMIIVQDYAIDMINTMYKIANPKVKEYKGYVYSTYSSLKQLEEQPEYSYTALLGAVDRTRTFVSDLNSLFHNIRKYHRRLGSFEVNQLLKEHFEKYEKEVQTIIDPLRTNDSVARFKHPILDILYSWREDDVQIALLVDQAMQDGKIETPDKAKEQVLEMIDYIIRVYNQVESTISRIYDKHSQYTRASIDRIKYKLDNSRDIKGVITKLISQAIDDDVVASQMEEVLDLTKIAVASDQSPFESTKRKVREDAKAEPVKIAEVPKELLDEFMDNILSRYSTKMIDDFVLEHLKDGYASTKDFEIVDDKQYILFLLSVIRGKEKSAPFNIKVGDRAVSIGQYKLAEVEFKLKGKINA